MLVISLSASPVAAQQRTGQKAGDSNHGSDPVVALAAGKKVTLTTRDGRDYTGYLALDGQDSVMVVHVSGAPIPPAALRDLDELAKRHPQSFSEVRRRGASYLLGHGVRLDSGGVFLNAQRLVELDAIATSIARADVGQVAMHEYRASPGWVGGAAAGGVFAGLLTATAIAYQPCGGSCGDEQLAMWGSVIGFPVLSGYGAYRATRHEVSHVLYTAP